MSTEENRALGRRWMAALEERNIEAAVALLAPDFVAHFGGLPAPVRGPEAWTHLFLDYHNAFPNMRISVEDDLAEGDTLVSRYTWRGTHTGAFNGIPATGKDVVGTGIGIFHVRDGKISEEWIQEDSVGLLQQLGAIPSPAPATA